MKIVSINVGLPQEVEYKGKLTSTGIFKSPIDGPVMMRSLNIDGDGQADLTVHGGVDKAVYAYPYEHYSFWRQKTGRDDFTLGQFGENLTTEGLLEDQVFIGDIFSIGQAVVQISQPRMPCFKLGIRMGDPQFPKYFVAAQRSGFYFRVLKEGEIDTGDIFERTVVDEGQMSVTTLFNLVYDMSDITLVERASQLSALPQEWREMFHEKLKK